MSVSNAISGRMVFYILGIVSLVQIGVFMALDVSNSRAARNQIGAMLDDGVLAVRRTLDNRADQLARMARALTSDPALQTAIAKTDTPGITNSLRDIGGRLRADLLLLATPEGKLIADASGKLHISGVSMSGRMKTLPRMAR